MLVFGGDTGSSALDEHRGIQNDLWYFSFESHQWNQIQPSPQGPVPPPRSLHAAAILTLDDGTLVMVIFAGLNLRDTWLYFPLDNRWQEATPPEGESDPGARYGHRLISYGSRAFLIGGAVEPGAKGHRIHNSVWELRVLHDSRVKWTEMFPSTEKEGIAPAARNYYGADLYVDESLGPLIILFGGANCKGSCICYGDTWGYHLERHEWFRVQAPELATRFHQTLVRLGSHLYTFGGESFNPRYMYHNAVEELSLQGDSSIVTIYGGLFFALACLCVMGWLWYRRRNRPKGFIIGKVD